MSHPAGMRGLKQHTIDIEAVGAGVASRRDAWIETRISGNRSVMLWSHPAGMRGLKL